MVHQNGVHMGLLDWVRVAIPFGLDPPCIKVSLFQILELLWGALYEGHAWLAGNFGSSAAPQAQGFWYFTAEHPVSRTWFQRVLWHCSPATHSLLDT